MSICFLYKKKQTDYIENAIKNNNVVQHELAIMHTLDVTCHFTEARKRVSYVTIDKDLTSI